MPRAKRSLRDSYLTVTLRPDERVAVERAAMAIGYSMSSWGRWALLKALPKRAPITAQGRSAEIAEVPATLDEISSDG